METLALFGIMSVLGYNLNQETSAAAPPLPGVPPEERPNSSNIYNSQMVKNAEDAVLALGVQAYANAKVPAQSGIIPPIFNNYNAQSADTPIASYQKQGAINELNKRSALTNKEPSIENRPMFNVPITPLTSVTNPSELPQSEFGSMTETRTVSLLTGQPLESTHLNQVPFFGSNTKQNVESFTNTTTLDLYTGKKDDFMHKKDANIKPMFAQQPQDIYQMNFVSNVELDRFIPSILKQSQKPFEPERIAAPKSGTLETTVPREPGIDELRAQNRPQISYTAPFKSGQVTAIMGDIGVVEKNRPETSFELGESRLFRGPGAVTAVKARENYSQIQETKYVGAEYFGSKSSGAAANARTQTQTATVDRRQQLDFTNETFRNETTYVPAQNDATRNILTNSLERDTTQNVTHILNANQSGSGHQVPNQTPMRSTIKQTTLSAFEGTVTGLIKKSDLQNITKFELPTTNKQQNLIEGYLGQGNKADGVGAYNVVAPFAKPTNSQINSVNNRGNAGSAPVATPENRQQYSNMFIRDSKQQLISRGDNINGPQRGHTPGSTAVIGEQKVRNNKTLQGQNNLSTNFTNVSNIRSSIPFAINESGIRGRKVADSVENREFANILNKPQLKDNVFALPVLGLE